ncbi:MAG: flagellin [Deltaproteobacteria bacterium]
MSVVINNNISSLIAQKNLGVTQSMLQKSIARLSSGMRITQASDDAAGLAISDKLNAQIRGLAQAQRNAGNGISVVATAEGALNEVTNLLTRMRELAVQAASGDLGSNERSNLNAEYAQNLAEIDRIANATKFNGQVLFSAGATVTFTFQIGINSGSENVISTTISDARTSALGVSATTIAYADSAQSVLATIDAAIETVASSRGSLGAQQNRLESVIRNLSVSIENTTAAYSRIRDVDVAEETATYTKNQILVQAGVAVLAQANQLPSVALSLLGG